jgi:hypothetical protein
MMAILTGVRWNLSVVLICTSFIARDGEHFVFSLIFILSSFPEILSSTCSSLLHWLSFVFFIYLILRNLKGFLFDSFF